MKLFNAGAKRPATNVAWASAASDLVKRTLAQHGLAASMGPEKLMDPMNLSMLDGVSARYAEPNSPHMTQHNTALSGASFEDGVFSCESGSRKYHLYVPTSASNGATGVVMMLHGCTQTPEGFAKGTNMNAAADRGRFIVVYPAQSRGDNAQSCWNWFSRGDQRRGRGEPDILAGLAQKICTEHGISRDQTFVAGLSAGAAMAVILGETYPDVFAAVGAHSGLPAGSAKDVSSAFAAMAGHATVAPDPVQAEPAVRTILFHGSADRTVHPSNGEGIARRARRANCKQTIASSETGQASGRRYQRDISTNADGVALVEHWTIEGQGHAWSGGQTGGSYTDPNGPDASAEMVRFFFENANKFV